MGGWCTQKGLMLATKPDHVQCSMFLAWPGLDRGPMASLIVGTLDNKVKSPDSADGISSCLRQNILPAFPQGATITWAPPGSHPLSPPMPHTRRAFPLAAGCLSKLGTQRQGTLFLI